jgi:hypothetical protein
MTLIEVGKRLVEAEERKGSKKMMEEGTSTCIIGVKAGNPTFFMTFDAVPQKVKLGSHACLYF